MNTRMLPTKRCAGSYGVKRENQIVQFASGKLRVKTIYRVRYVKGERIGAITGSNLQVRWITGVSWVAE